MNESIISWTNRTWNPMHGCSKVSDGCAYCYAMNLSLKRGWTTKAWTMQNEQDNVLMKPHKLIEPYKLGNEPQRIFVNSMSDMFHPQIPDWYKAVIFCIMLDHPQHVFQILTKRTDATITWHNDFVVALQTDEFKQFAETVKDKRIKATLAKQWDSPWGDNIWMGTSVEDARVQYRIPQLQQSLAKIKFISAEPLIGAWSPINLTGIDWIIVGGESGLHMKKGNKRWMQPKWAMDIKNMCVDQRVAFFFKQDSGYKTEMHPYLWEDGFKWQWHQYPNQLLSPVLLA